MPEKSVLITGCTGLLGRALALRLHAKGRSVVGMDLSTPEMGRLPFPTIVANVNDVHRLYGVLGAYRVDAVVHCGGISGRMVARDNPALILDTNIRGSWHVLEAARQLRLRRVVMCSSVSVYGNAPPDPVTDLTPPRPSYVYGASKAAVEDIVDAYAAERGVDGVSLRIFHVYGPRRMTECYIRIMIENALAGRPTRIAQPAEARRQYVYVDDVVDALELALDAGKLPHRIYNVWGGTTLTLREVADTVASIVPGVKVEFGDDPSGREYAIRGVDASLAERELGYRPKTTLAAGIAAYRDWLKEQRR